MSDERMKQEKVDKEKGGEKITTKGYPVELKSGTGTFKMILERPGLIEDLIFDSGGWEPGIIRILSGLLKDEGLFLDIGANIGYYTLYMASEFPNMRCIGFEPSPAIFEQFKRNVRENPFRNISIYDYAVGDFYGQTRFHVTGETHYNRALSAVNYYEHLEKDFERIGVRIITLDSFLNKDWKKDVRAIKIDTQGFEYEVLRGASEIIRQSKPVVCFESHSYSKYSESEIISLLPGYRIYKIQAWSGEIREYEEPDPPDYGKDMLCIPPGMAFTV